MTPTIPELLKQALLSDDPAQLKRLLDRREEILRALDDDDVDFSDQEWESLQSRPDRLAEFYRLLGDGAPSNPAVAEAEEILGRFQDDEATEIGTAFSELLAGLPPNFSAWDTIFAAVPDAPARYQKMLAGERAVEIGGKYARGLVRYGLSPVMFAEAAYAVGGLLDRLAELARAPSHDRRMSPPTLAYLRRMSGEVAAGRFELNMRLGGADDPGQVPRELLFSHVAGTPGLPPQATEALVIWMAHVATLRPFFFLGYEAERTGRAKVALHPDVYDQERSLVFRWTTPMPMRVGAFEPA
jgi:hypothetical protein